MYGVSKLAKILTKVFEVLHWVGTCLMAMVGFLSVAAPQWLKYFIDIEGLKAEREVSVYGLEAAAANPAGEINTTTLCLFAVGAVIILVLIALIFRNLHQIIKSSENTTPFCKENVRMLKQIGVCSFAVPIVRLGISILIHLIAGVEFAKIQVSFDGFVMGIVILCLTQYFAHGVELQNAQIKGSE